MKILKLEAWNFSSLTSLVVQFFRSPPSCWFWSIQIFRAPLIFSEPPFRVSKHFRRPPQYLHSPPPCHIKWTFPYWGSYQASCDVTSLLCKGSLEEEEIETGMEGARGMMGRGNLQSLTSLLFVSRCSITSSLQPPNFQHIRSRQHAPNQTHFYFVKTLGMIITGNNYHVQKTSASLEI